jgi:hypothetical protein
MRIATTSNLDKMVVSSSSSLLQSRMLMEEKLSFSPLPNSSMYQSMNNNESPRIMCSPILKELTFP